MVNIFERGRNPWIEKVKPVRFPPRKTADTSGRITVILFEVIDVIFVSLESKGGRLGGADKEVKQ